ncbi:hypothetical protein [Myroides sp. LoEW2-1]|uniref:hypothetical protein n=1 Tax=Myroides sp. LoEW2-1 TaxID=2683192 RepID=UPI001329A282|nr:hypothetical protein [Myroides sp. LoEW2-1]MVX35323.1 hypothetical protein [Myroides sp. LoEW2-1]
MNFFAKKEYKVVNRFRVLQEYLNKVLEGAQALTSPNNWTTDQQDRAILLFELYPEIE